MSSPSVLSRPASFVSRVVVTLLRRSLNWRTLPSVALTLSIVASRSSAARSAVNVSALAPTRLRRAVSCGMSRARSVLSCSDEVFRLSVMSAALCSVRARAGSAERRLRLARIESSLGSMAAMAGTIFSSSPMAPVWMPPSMVSPGSITRAGLGPSTSVIVTPPMSSAESSARVPAGTRMASSSSMPTRMLPGSS